jgi:adenosylcobinamide-GDP ribazoletransferase
MRDPQTGAGGFTLGWMILSATTFAIASLNQRILVHALILAETAAAFSMVFQTFAGKPAHKGMFSFFWSAMRRNGNVRILVSAILMLLIAVATLYKIGLAVCLVAVAIPLVIISISNHTFGGITGDVLGATNELTRLTSLIIIVALMKWS